MARAGALGVVGGLRGDRENGFSRANKLLHFHDSCTNECLLVCQSLTRMHTHEK